jgi:hypothetical protein
MLLAGVRGWQAKVWIGLEGKLRKARQRLHHDVSTFMCCFHWRQAPLPLQARRKLLEL